MKPTGDARRAGGRDQRGSDGDWPNEYFHNLVDFGVALEPDELDAAAARMDPALVADFMAGRLNPTY